MQSRGFPESQLRAFIDSLMPTPSEIEHARAAGLREAGDLAGFQPNEIAQRLSNFESARRRECA